jgi:cholesterol oxidase
MAYEQPAGADSLPRDAPLASLRAQFRSLPAPTSGDLTGRWDALAVGPRWYRALFAVLLWAGGLRGWRGKEFSAGGAGVNLCRRGDRLLVKSRLRLEGPVASREDGRPALRLRYLDRSPLGLVRDDLRSAPGGTVLGLTYLRLPLLSRVRLPFAIRRAEAPAPA